MSLNIVAEELERTAAKPVRSAACDDVDGGAGLTAVFGGEFRRLDLHFLDEVETDVVDLTAVLPESRFVPPSMRRLLEFPRAPLMDWPVVLRLVVKSRLSSLSRAARG